MTPSGQGGSTDLTDIAVVRDRLERWSRARYGHDVRVPETWPMPGNAGVSFGFDVVPPQFDPVPLVIRLSPPGVRRRGNTDVLRQVPLLRTLGEAGIPVARVVWSSGDPAWFGTDAVVQERLAAWPLHMWDGALSHPAADTGSDPFVDQAVDTLAAIHRTAWAERLGDWEPVRSLASELDFWGRLLSRCGEPAWIEDGARLRDALMDRQPDGSPVGIFHGDYQTNNVLYDESGLLVGVVDWEISGLGPQLLDLGWLSIFTDPSCWDPSYVAGMRVAAEPQAVRSRYEEARRRKVEGFDYFRALACFRFGAIGAFNVRLHRTGRRVDASYERIAPSVSTLFERGRALIAA